MTTLLKCPICGGTERSLLPSSVCEECGCDMMPVECYCGHPENPGTHSPGCFAPDGKRYTRPAEEYLIAEARRVLFDKSQPKEARMAAMSVLQPKPAEAREPVDLLEVARQTGLRPFIEGNATEVRERLTRFAAALKAQPRDTPRDSGDALCPNCVNPWKCNGPHIGLAPAMQPTTGEPSDG